VILTLFENEFSWSVSRDAVFRKCRRKYFYQYYGSWGGWSLDAADKTRAIYVLKQLKNRQMWAGTKVHEAIAMSLKSLQNGVRIDENELIEDTLSLMRAEFKSSLAKMFLIEPKTCALFEHEYEVPVSDREWKINADHVVECLKHFFDSTVFREILQLTPDQWLEVEEFSSFYYRGFKIYSVFDFACRKNEEIYIYDWKTGKDEYDKHNLQLFCYGLFATSKWDVIPAQVQLREFNLSSGNMNELSLAEFDLDGIHKQILNSIEDMLNCLEDRQTNLAVEERFDLSENRKICERCNYVRICPR
jgi:hypothetical protein